MRVNYRGEIMPFPVNIIRGKLRLAGLSHSQIATVVQELSHDLSKANPVHEWTVLEKTRMGLKTIGKELQSRFELVLRYDALRRQEDNPIPPVVLVLEGASATGKSMLAMSMISNLGATRILSTDTLRQVLRSILSKDEHPELFCHTYQAHKHRKTGDQDLADIVRGYLAQTELISPVLRKFTGRVLSEGTEAIIEGVHVIPGSLGDIGEGVLEIVVNLPPNIHKTMFMSKRDSTGLMTVSDEPDIREDEYQATRLIQDFLLREAKRARVRILELRDYDEAEYTLNQILLDHIKELVATYGKGS